MFKQGCLSKEKQSFINTQQNLTSEFRSRTEEAALFAARRKQNAITLVRTQAWFVWNYLIEWEIVQEGLQKVEWFKMLLCTNVRNVEASVVLSFQTNMRKLNALHLTHLLTRFSCSAACRAARLMEAPEKDAGPLVH